MLINGIQSPHVNVTFGVHQGSVLGPLLLSIFINDVVECVSSNMRLYADDCVLCRDVACSTDMLALQCDLDKIEVWCFKRSMFSNVSKCIHTRFTRKTNLFAASYFIAGSPAKLLTEAEYSEVLISSAQT